MDKDTIIGGVIALIIFSLVMHHIFKTIGSSMNTDLENRVKEQTRILIEIRDLLKTNSQSKY